MSTAMIGRLILRFGLEIRTAGCALAALAIFWCAGLEKCLAGKAAKQDSGSASASLATDPRAPALYGRHCQSCHGKDGKGSRVRANRLGVPDFTRKTWQADHKELQLIASIVDGKGARMPPFNDRLTTEEIKALVVYIRTLGGVQIQAEQSPRDEFDQQIRELREAWKQLREQFQEAAAEADKM